MALEAHAAAQVTMDVDLSPSIPSGASLTGTPTVAVVTLRGVDVTGEVVLPASSIINGVNVRFVKKAAAVSEQRFSRCYVLASCATSVANIVAAGAVELLLDQNGRTSS